MSEEDKNGEAVSKPQGGVVHQEIVILKIEDLMAGKDLTKEIERAYGFDGLGILAVSGVENLEEMRQNLLTLANRFANLPPDVKAKYEHEPSYYAVGWSHGKEKLQGQPDFSKGSWYANPLFNRPVDDEELIKRWPSFLSPNLWPQEVPELESAFMTLGSAMIDVGKLVGKQCDAFIHQKAPDAAADRLFNTINQSRVGKGRLLHYFCKSQEELAKMESDNVDGKSSELEFSSWCGWHNDHGSLTALCPAIYTEQATGKVIANPDPQAGLYIRSRQGQLVKPTVPPGHLLFQIGETAQIHSGGLLQATPHAVRGCSVPGVNREAFAVFMEPEWWESMDAPKSRDVNDVQKGTSSKFLPAGIPELAERWGTDKCPFTTCNFGAFTEETFSRYY